MDRCNFLKQYINACGMIPHKPRFINVLNDETKGELNIHLAFCSNELGVCFLVIYYSLRI